MCSEKYQNTQKLLLHIRQDLVCVLKIMAVPLEKEEDGSTAHVCKDASEQTTRSFGIKRSKRRCLDTKPSAMFGENKVPALQPKHLVPSMKHGGGGVMIFGLVLQPRNLESLQSSSQPLTLSILRLSGGKHEAIHEAIYPPDKLYDWISDPKSSNESASEQLKKRRIKVFQRRSHDPDLNPINSYNVANLNLN